jgi:protein-S-isoprenylcysteine O-methyltransferase Ste14
MQKVLSPGVVLSLLVIVVVVPLLPLLISWHWGWWQAWAFAAISIFGFVVSRWLAARRHPDLLAERARFFDHEDAKPWDKVLSPLVGLGGGVIPLVVGLDARYAWSTGYGPLAHAVSLIVILAGYALGTYALVENRYFSGMVRIQTDRQHAVVSTGPYAWMRHPGYVAALTTYLATPVLLDSRWAFVPVALLIVILVVRTRLEDDALMNELEGYRDYARRVRFRLLPGVW